MTIDWFQPDWILEFIISVILFLGFFLPLHPFLLLPFAPLHMFTQSNTFLLFPYIIGCGAGFKTGLPWSVAAIYWSGVGGSLTGSKLREWNEKAFTKVQPAVQPVM